MTRGYGSAMGRANSAIPGPVPGRVSAAGTQGAGGARLGMVPATLLAMVLGAAVGCDRGEAPVRPLVVFAAASTVQPMTEAARRFEAERGARVLVSADSSSTLARQIKAGAAADVFVSADQRWMDDVVAAGAMDASTRVDLLTNELVLAAPKGHALEASLVAGLPFTDALPGVRRLAVGDPGHVPLGRYAMQSLRHFGWEEAARPRLLPAPDARAALRLVELGEADAGVLYASDARGSEAIVIVATFPSESHEPVRCPAAVRRDAPATARDFLAFLMLPAQSTLFEDAGFGVPTPGADRP